MIVLARFCETIFMDVSILQNFKKIDEKDSQIAVLILLKKKIQINFAEKLKKFDANLSNATNPVLTH